MTARSRRRPDDAFRVGIVDPVPAGIRTELERLGERWRTLPLDRALCHASALRAAAERCAELLPNTYGAPTELVRDLGPACALDQLSTLAYDLCEHRARDAAHAVEAEDAEAWLTEFAAQIAALRTSLG